MQDLVNEAASAPLTYRATTRSGVRWRIDVAPSGAAIGETMQVSVAVEGERLPQVSAGSAELVAQGSRSSTSLDLGSIAAGAMGLPDDEGEREALPTKERTTTFRLATVTAPMLLATGTTEPSASQPSVEGTRVGSFELAIPISAPPRMQTNALTISWTLHVRLETESGPDAVRIGDLPVLLAAGRLAETPHLQPGAMERVVNGSEGGVEWSIEMDELPLVTGRPYRGTLRLAATDRLRGLRPEVRVEGRSVRETPKGVTVGWLEWIERGKVVSDDFDADGSRRVVFEGRWPDNSFATTVAGDTTFRAKVRISLRRWGLFGSDFERPVAVASLT